MQYAQYIAVSICTACVYVMRYDCIEYKSCHQADYPRLTRADTLSGGKKLALDIVIVLGGRSAHLRPLPRHPQFLRAGKSLGVFRERKLCRTRLTKQAGISPPMRKTKSGAVSAPKNRVCPCQSRVRKRQIQRFPPTLFHAQFCVRSQR